MAGFKISNNLFFFGFRFPESKRDGTKGKAGRWKKPVKLFGTDMITRFRL